MQVTIPEAAAHLHISQQTIRRRLASGVIKGEKLETPQGFRWLIEVEDQDQEETDDHDQNNNLVDMLKAQVMDLQAQLSVRSREIDQLHQLLAAKALQGPVKHWWAFWK